MRGAKTALSLGRWPSIQARISSSCSGWSWIAPSRLMLMLANSCGLNLSQFHSGAMATAPTCWRSPSRPANSPSISSRAAWSSSKIRLACSTWSVRMWNVTQTSLSWLADTLLSPQHRTARIKFCRPTTGYLVESKSRARGGLGRTRTVMMLVVARLLAERRIVAGDLDGEGHLPAALSRGAADDATGNFASAHTDPRLARVLHVVRNRCGTQRPTPRQATVSISGDRTQGELEFVHADEQCRRPVVSAHFQPQLSMEIALTIRQRADRLHRAKAP